MFAAAATLAKVDGREGQAVETMGTNRRIREGADRTCGREPGAEFNQSECVRVAPNAPRTGWRNVSFGRTTCAAPTPALLLLSIWQSSSSAGKSSSSSFESHLVHFARNVLMCKPTAVGSVRPPSRPTPTLVPRRRSSRATDQPGRGGTGAE